jgi:hypothetical protein
MAVRGYWATLLVSRPHTIPSGQKEPTMKKIALLTATVLSSLALSAPAFAQSAPVITPQGIVVNPVQTTLQAKVFVDRAGVSPVYFVGENIRISVSVNQDAYVYLFSIDSAGKVDMILPNRLSGGSEFMRGGETRQFPPAGANWQLTVTGNGGAEKILAVASKRQLNLSEIATFQNNQPFATTTVQGSTGLARPLAVVVTPLPPEDWVTTTADYTVQVRQYTAPQPNPPVASTPPVFSSDPLFRFDLSLMPGMNVLRVTENKSDKYSAFVSLPTSIGATAQYHQNQLQARGWALRSSRIRNDSVRLEFRRGTREMEYRLERNGNGVRLSIEID